MADKKISELGTASVINNSDNIELSQDTGNGLVSLKATILALATKILTNINFTSVLTTTDKTITGAINEIAEGGGGGGTDVIADDFDSTATYAVGDYCIYDGKLYKCTTAVTTAGDWDSSDWTETLVMDEVEQGGGGGGGGGHTIKDDSGNALTQRSNLQFKGVYTHDNSSGNASVVEVAREMTWAEYQQLSASEKKGLITITDRFTADAMFVDGVFIDTDNVIQTATAIPNGTSTYIATEDCIVAYQLVATASGCNIQIDNCIIDGLLTGSNYNVVSGNAYLKKGQTIKFVQTSNDAGNYVVYGIQEGTNPSIPDYSTTEHKTGRKWIDGKDIWECTFELSSPLSLSSSGFTSSSIDASNMETFVNVTTLSSNGDAYNGVITAVVNNYLAFAHWWNGISIKTVTVQYTKSS